MTFVLSFVYLDKNKHKVYYYTINFKGQNVGTVKVDKFVTEDKLIYKSVSSTPLYELFTDSRLKMVFDRKYNLESYAFERTANKATELVYIEAKNNVATYVARLNSRFAFLDEIKLRDNTTCLLYTSDAADE